MNLTRRALWLGALVLLLGVVAQWLPGTEGRLWRDLAALWLVALGLEGVWAAVLPLRAQWDIPRPLRLGRRSVVTITLRAGGTRALDVDAFLTPPAGVQAEAQPQLLQVDADGAQLRQEWTQLRLGALTPPPLQLRVLGRFGLAWWSRQLPCDDTGLQVEPDLFGDEPALTGRRSGAVAPLHARGSGGELLGLRDYQRGDPLRTLAWKASARRNRLLVREFAQEQQLDLMIVIDAGRAGRQQIGALTRLHHAVNAAARLARRAITLGDCVGLIVYDGRGVRTVLAPRNGMQGLQRLRSELAQLTAHPDDADPLQAALTLRRSCPRRALALWFTDVDTGASTTALRSCAQLLVPRHLPLFAGLVDREVKTLAERSPHDWKDPYIAIAAVQTIEAAERQTRTLRHLGCQVVQAAPEEIDARLLGRYQALRAQHAV